jgi:hypothetical protein
MRPRSNNSILLRIAQAEAVVNYCQKFDIHPSDLFGKKVIAVDKLEFGENAIRALLATDTVLLSLHDDVENFSSVMYKNHLAYSARIEHYDHFKRCFDSRAFSDSVKFYLTYAKKQQLNITIYSLIWSLLFRSVESFKQNNIKKLLSMIRAKDMHSALAAAALSSFCFRSNENLILLKKNCSYKHSFYKRIYDEDIYEKNKHDYILHHSDRIIRSSDSLKDMLIKSFDCKKYQSDIAAFTWGAVSCRFKKEKIPASFVYFHKVPDISVKHLLEKSTQLMQLIKNSESATDIVI